MLCDADFGPLYAVARRLVRKYPWLEIDDVRQQAVLFALEQLARLGTYPKSAILYRDLRKYFVLARFTQMERETQWVEGGLPPAHQNLRRPERCDMHAERRNGVCQGCKRERDARWRQRKKEKLCA